jgi:hypothetical protein
MHAAIERPGGRALSRCGPCSLALAAIWCATSSCGPGTFPVNGTDGSSRPTPADGAAARGTEPSQTDAPIPVASPPDAPALILPPPAAPRVQVPVVLAWSPAARATAYDVFLGTSFDSVAQATTASPAYLGRQSVTSLTTSAPPYRTTCFWRVDAIGEGGVAPSEVRPFTVQPPPLPAPVISAEYEVTDSSAGHTVGNAPNPECSSMVRVDKSLHFLYRSKTPQGLFVRTFDLESGTFAPAVLVDGPTDPPDYGYHSEPTLLRDADGRLHVFNQYGPTRGSCTNQYGMAPRYRVIPDLADPGAWSAPGCLPARMLNAFGGIIYDAMAVYDDRTGVSHCVGQTFGLTGLDGRPNDGFSRGYYRVMPTGQPDGPYVIVESATGWIPELPAGVSAAIHAKGDLMLGREVSGPRSLHVMWNIRATWNDGSIARQCNANLYYARSTDGGQTWTNAAGTATVPLIQHVQLNDARFLAYEGDVDQDSERSFDVDSQSRPVFVYKRHRPGTGVVIGNRIDVLASPVPVYDLVWRRWNGTSWVGGVISATTNWIASRTKVRMDLDDNIYVFFGDLPGYYVSKDAGQTWSGPVHFGSHLVNGRLYSYYDYIDPDYHVIAYTDRYTWRHFFVRIQLTAP